MNAHSVGNKQEELEATVLLESYDIVPLLKLGGTNPMTGDSPQESQTLEVTEKVWKKEDIPLVEEDQVREQLSTLHIHKSMGPDGMHPRVLRELAEVITGPLSIIFERSWRAGDMSKDWRKANVTLVFKKGMTGWIDEAKAVDVVYLVFSKVFDTVSHSILIGKFRKCGLDE
ncbi:rna-directed dna polymerase from mobile element hypothetical protein [Limosa lapponica baueri]|uniref:Rna-directed dna polymerase from mobile element jockey-like n=1 Tax=Limosa lapponica baueri TaxID=1758121 RepID=A0A2I0TVH7_LIMLA|nr:rna-directed dna polymerase from mobile element hypothetical protein [Limosa lapponica baueri]